MNLVYVYFSVTQNVYLIITDTQRHYLEKMIRLLERKYWQLGKMNFFKQEKKKDQSSTIYIPPFWVSFVLQKARWIL